MSITVGIDTYISVDDAKQYISDFGLESFSTDAELETALKRSTKMIDRIYGNRFIGTKSTIDQKLAWPRLVGRSSETHYEGEWVGVAVDSDGNPRDFSGIPVEITQATVELAEMMKAGVDPMEQPGALLQSLSVDSSSGSSISETYADSGGHRSKPLHKVNVILRPLLAVQTGLMMTRGS